MIKGQRCVILADGFYEWRKQNKHKQPFFIYFPQTESQEKPEDEDDLVTFADDENSKIVCLPKKASVDFTKVCFQLSVALSVLSVCAFMWNRSREKAAVEEIATAKNSLCGRGKR